MKLRWVYHLGQIGLAQNANGMPGISGGIHGPEVLGGQSLGAVQHQQGQICALCGLQCAGYADLLHRIPGVADSGGVDQAQHQPTQMNLFLHGIPGGAGNVGDNHPLVARQGVEQTGFSCIRPPENDGFYAVPDDLSPLAGGKQLLQRVNLRVQQRRVILEGEIVDVLVGIVQHCVKMAHHGHQRLINGIQLPQQGPTHLTGCIGCRIGGFRFDQVDDGLGSGEIHPAVQKCALGKFPGARLTCAVLKQGGEGLGEHRRGAVALELHGVLAGVAVGAGGIDRQNPVNDPPLPVVEIVKAELPGDSFRQRLPVYRGENFGGSPGAAVAGEPDHADA